MRPSRIWRLTRGRQLLSLSERLRTAYDANACKPILHAAAQCSNTDKVTQENKESN